MKYYKLINENGWGKSFTKDKIYPENQKLPECLLEIGSYAKGFPKDWKRVEQWEYYLQEGINPFKVGDKVKFVDRTGLTKVEYGVNLSWAREDKLDKTKVYEVSKKAGFDILIDTSPIYYNSIQFELYDEKSCLPKVTDESIIPEQWYVRDCAKVSYYASEKWGCSNEIDPNRFYVESNETYFFLTLEEIKEQFPKYTEITEEQFIKYVMKQEFVLPEKWCIKVTPEDSKPSNPIYKWRGVVSPNGCHHWYSCGYLLGNNGWWNDEIPYGYEEITKEQFNKYVIKKLKSKVEQPAKGGGEVPEKVSFYVRYTPVFTEDVYNALMEYSIDVCKDGIVRGFADNYKGLKENKYFVCDNYGLNHSSYLPNHGRYSYGVDNNPQRCAKELTVEEVKELIKDYLKPKEMDKPRAFIIEGSTPLIKAMASELLDLGYTDIDLDSFTEKNPTNIQMNRSDKTLLKDGIEVFKELFLSDSVSYFCNNPSAERFSLPEDYNKAIKFAKEQLNHPYWKIDEQKFEVGDWILVLESGYNCGDHPKYNSELFVKKGDVVRIEQIENYKGFDVAICTGGEIIRIGEYPECFKTITFEDAKERLLEIAKEKYPVGTCFRVAHNTSYVEKVSSHDNFKNNFVIDSKDCLHINLLVSEDDDPQTGGASVYFNGTWAEIVENPQPKIEINGYKAKFDDYNKTVSFGCQTIGKEMAEKLLELSEYSITLVDVDGGELTKEIEQIVDYFNSLD